MIKQGLHDKQFKLPQKTVEFIDELIEKSEKAQVERRLRDVEKGKNLSRPFDNVEELMEHLNEKD